MAAEGSGQGLRPIAVRELCAFTARRGDLDLRFTPAPTAQEGIEGHAAVRLRRGAGYVQELRLEGACRSLWIRGRADGLEADPLVLEEIKTHRGPVESIPDNHRALHWAQLKLYGAQLCLDRQLATLALRLVYFHVDSGQETRLESAATAEELLAFRDDHAARFETWARAEAAHRERRDVALKALRFPHADFHRGQRLLAEAVYRGLARGGTLMAQAPTGIGKSIGTLFPALKALGEGHVDKLFFLTAKSSGRRAALSALESLRAGDAPLPLRHLELVARDKACVHPDKACHGDSCPRAKGFFDRLPAAREAAVAQGALDHAAVQAVAEAHTVCPYYLAQELVRWADVVIGDVNYYFDAHALLPALTAVNDWRVAVLVDEAHNLVERARGMYSAELRADAVPRLPPRSDRRVSRALTKLRGAWKALALEHAADYTTLSAPPPALMAALQELVSSLGKLFAEQPAAAPPALLQTHFDALAFLERAETLDTHSLCDLERADGSLRLTLRNVLPAPFLAPRFAAAKAAVLFSATLHPAEYFQTLLGLPETTRRLDVPSPFAAGQLQVRVARAISTRYRDRAASLDALVATLAAQCAERPGNYLAFFSSYAYLQQAETLLRARHPGLSLLVQTRAMRESDQAAFLERFSPTGRELGLAVLGGAFAEGIDLPGQRLVGVFVATLGLPQVNAVQEAKRQRLEQLFGAHRGYDYAYLHPGLQKVVQAAGRVIRTPEDRGVIWLMDDRYARKDVRQLLPGWWPAAIG